MGLVHGNVSVSRYKVLGQKKSFKLKELSEYFAPYQAKKVQLQGAHHSEKVLWAKPSLTKNLEYVDPNEHWDLSDCQLEDGFVLRMQIDKRKVPAQLLQLTIKERLHRKNERRAKPLSNAERKQLIADTKKELLALALPELSFVDAFWRPEGSDLLIFATTKNVLRHFEGLFNKTFCEHLDLNLVRMDPPLLNLAPEEWLDEDLAGKKLAKLSLTVPSPFHNPSSL